jgi:hypothetical protein
MNKFYQALAGFVFLLVFISCKKEYSQEGSSNKKCIHCIYLPVCDSSVFVYTDSSSTGLDTLTNVMSVFGDTTINGKTFTAVSGFATFNTGLYANCDNQDYRLLFSTAALGINIDSLINDLLTQLPFPIPPGLVNFPSTIQTSVLKANLAANATWTDTIYQLAIPPLLSFNVGINYTLVAKGLQRSIYQNNFTNVIHVKSELAVVSSLINVPLDLSIDYFFAKDVGLVEVQVSQAAVLQRVLKLYSFQL